MGAIKLRLPVPGLAGLISFLYTVLTNDNKNMKKVAIYTTPTCVYCKHTKEFFKEHNVAYEEFNVGSDLTRRQEMITKSGQMGVPVIAITDEAGGEKIIVGFDEEALSSSLGVA